MFHLLLRSYLNECHQLYHPVSITSTSTISCTVVLDARVISLCLSFLQSCAETAFMRSLIIYLFSVPGLLPSSALAPTRGANIRTLGEQQGLFGSSANAPYSKQMSTSLRSLSEPSELQDRSLQLKEIVILGLGALQRLRSNTKYSVPPLSENASFLNWAKETSKRKYFSDKEFKERIKVRELKRLHLTEISG